MCLLEVAGRSIIHHELQLLYDQKVRRVVLCLGHLGEWVVESVGDNVSPNLVTALQFANEVGTPVIGIIGKDGGYTAKVAAACVIVLTANPDHITPHFEAFQAVVWHLLVLHPKPEARQTKWESVQ